MTSLRVDDHLEPAETSSCTSRPSLYAAFTLPRLVHTFKNNLRSRLSSHCVPLSRQQEVPSCNADGQYDGFFSTCASLRRCFRNLIIRSHIKCSYLDPGARAPTFDTDIPGLLDGIDALVKPQRASTVTLATQDELFLQYDSRRTVARKSAKDLQRVLDLSADLLSRLHTVSNASAVRVRDLTRETATSVGLECPKSLANLEHMLCCLQQAALEGLVYQSIKRSEDEVAHWYQYWKQRRHTCEAWFTEWPCGRRPLSTTWPWNIKPSLVVLWGVCWMFYGASESRPEQAAILSSVPFWTGQPPQPGWIGSEAWKDNAQISVAPTNPFWSVAQAESHSRQPSELLGDCYTLPASSTSLVSTPYISLSPSTSSASFATSPQFWPQQQGIHSLSNYIYEPGFTLSANQSPQFERPVIQTPIIPNVNTAAAVYPYVQPSLSNISYEEGRGQARQNISTNLQVNSLALRASTMHNYPSPRSEMSVKSRSPSLSLYPTADANPGVPYTTVPSRRSSPYGSPQSAKSEEPARNDQGQMYCAHEDCASKQPIFARKCEWTKHMDKHNRPYVCEERGCEKINGFTYSGGLLRHQREVHKQHGGPKASCMCPHKDCKRSTGVGFSRRENLLEHLRRVHRGAEDNDKDAQMSMSKAPGVKKRRKPFEDERVEEFEASSSSKKRKIEGDEQMSLAKISEQKEDLQNQIQSLQHQLQQKDERLQKLEEAVAKLGGG